MSEDPVPYGGLVEAGAQQALTRRAVEPPALPVFQSKGEVDNALMRLGLGAEYVKGQMAIMQQMIKDVMVPDVHYGVIPGTAKEKERPKPALYKAGAELLLKLFQLVPVIVEERVEWAPEESTTVEYWDKRAGKRVTREVVGHLSAYYRIDIVAASTDAVVATATGEANSWEKKYVWSHVGDLKNTLMQMGWKRAFVQAVRLATATSGFFSVDEDFYKVEAGWHPAEEDGGPEEPAAGNGGAVSDMDTRKAIVAKYAASTGRPAGEIMAMFNRADWDEAKLVEALTGQKKATAAEEPKATPKKKAAAPPAATGKKPAGGFMDI